MMRIQKYIVGGCIALAVMFIVSVFIPLSEERFAKENIHSVKVFDRNHQLLREYLNDVDWRGEWIPLEKISPAVIDATITIEDKRFANHFGIDPIAVLRAIWDNILFDGSRVGASTITQQVIRNIYHHPRTLIYKVEEAWYALRLERMMTKRNILEQYLNRAPYGNQLFGIKAASKYYFDKPASDLTIAEAAFLAGLPNSPTLLNPYLHYQRAVFRQRLILKILVGQKKISQSEYERAVLQQIPVVLPESKFKAPHAVEMVYAHFKDQSRPFAIQTTIDAALQKDVEWIIKGHLEQLKSKNVTNASVVILQNRTGEVRTLVGSADYFNDLHQGKINGTIALRQPGSSVKIFTYGIALESGLTPASLLADIPTSIPVEGGDYVPENYDKEFHGPVLLRTALACSYNIPAVRILHLIGVDALYQRMQSAGITSLTESPKYYGVGLTLGNAEVSLLEMTNAYRTVANGGILSPIKIVQSVMANGGKLMDSTPMPCECIETRRVFDGNVCYLLTDILSDHSARRPAFGKNFNFSFPCAVKTGTTKDYKDNWTLGFTTEYTVGVWVGNFDAKPMRKVSGVSGAGVIFTDIMNLLETKYGADSREFVRPEELKPYTVCARSGMLKNDYCDRGRVEYFLPGTFPTKRCTVHQQYYILSNNGKMTGKVYEIFPPEYEEWCINEQITKPPINAQKENDLDLTKEGNSFAIIYPHQGDIFKVDPILRKEYQKLKLEAIVPLHIQKVQLRINGTEIIPYQKNSTWWELKRGVSSLQLTGMLFGKEYSSARVKIFVE